MAEADHDAPFIEDLLDDADVLLRNLGNLSLLRNLGNLSVTGLECANPVQIDALHRLWSTFLRLPQRGEASCVGITKAILLLTHGRIGPAFDSSVRMNLGIKTHPKSSEEWIDLLRLVGQ